MILSIKKDRVGEAEKGYGYNLNEIGHWHS